MFFIQVFFENGNIEFNFTMDYLSVEKNEEKFFDEIEKLRPYITKYNTKINFDAIYSKFEKFKNEFSKKFLIEERFNQDIRFKINDDSCQEKEQIIRFIKNNKNLNITLSIKNYEYFIKNLKDEDYPNLKIAFINSQEPISYKEFYDMYKKLDEIVEFVKYYDLSPLERVFLVYDIVKSNTYTKEGKDEPYGKSRDLNQIVNGDKIVCVGYANLINYLLTNLGIKNKCMMTYNEEKKVGHEKNYIFLDDEKYNLKGCFFLDATADSKRNDNYIDNYKYFLKSFDFFYSEKETILNPKELNLLSKSSDQIFAELRGQEKDTLSQLIKLLSFVDIKYSMLHTLVSLFYNSDRAKELIDIVKEAYNIKSIGEKNFKTALYKVRRIEYINNIVKNDITEEYVDSVFKKNFKLDMGTIRLLEILGMYEQQNIDKELINVKDINIDNLRMKLIKILKLNLNDFSDNQYIKKM